MINLWSSTETAAWRDALERYRTVVEQQGVKSLPELDRWYRDELPPTIAARSRPHVTLTELVRITEWKMARGVWREPNLIRVRGNAPSLVIEVTAKALAMIPSPTAPVAAIAELDGVGPATASGVLSASAPAIYPFFDELVAGQVPALGKVAWTLPYYVRYATALRDRARALGDDWTPVMVERALWSNIGGKRGSRSAK